MTESQMLRVGGIAAISGALLLFLSTLLHPLEADPNDPVAAFQEYAGDNLWVASHLGQFLGIAVLVVGLFILTRWLVDTEASFWARVGAAGATATLTLMAALQAVDGIALKVMVDAWVAAPPSEKPMAFQAALAVRQIEIGLASMVGLVFGITTAIYGLVVARCGRLPTWLGWVAVGAGILTALAGIVMAYTGFSELAMNLSMPASFVLILWVITIGILMYRRAGEVGTSGA